MVLGELLPEGENLELACECGHGLMETVKGVRIDGRWEDHVIVHCTRPAGIDDLFRALFGLNPKRLHYYLDIGIAPNPNPWNEMIKSLFEERVKNKRLRLVQQ